MSKRQKRRAWRLGLHAESWAAWSLVCCGYRILARRFRSAVGEIDIIARRGPLLCFVEVKARTAVIDETPVSQRQMRRIERASLLFLQSQPNLREMDLRYDVILVRPWRWPVHLTDIWRP
ncbi:MAG: YraN family protein [Rhodospirillales bacterium]|nr:YraN family protein [Rhodospirillales bacterium]